MYLHVEYERDEYAYGQVADGHSSQSIGEDESTISIHNIAIFLFRVNLIRSCSLYYAVPFSQPVQMDHGEAFRVFRLMY